MHFSFTKSKSKRSDLYQHTPSHATNRLQAENKKYIISQDIKGREIAIRKLRKKNSIFKLNWLHPVFFDEREEARVPKENPQ